MKTWSCHISGLRRCYSVNDGSISSGQNLYFELLHIRKTCSYAVYNTEQINQSKTTSAVDN